MVASFFFFSQPSYDYIYDFGFARLWLQYYCNVVVVAAVIIVVFGCFSRSRLSLVRECGEWVFSCVFATQLNLLAWKKNCTFSSVSLKFIWLGKLFYSCVCLCKMVYRSSSPSLTLSLFFVFPPSLEGRLFVFQHWLMWICI